MADVESSLLYFCSKVVAYNKVTLTGECADEIFGGYPWFHQEKAFRTPAFPWSSDLAPRNFCYPMMSSPSSNGRIFCFCL